MKRLILVLLLSFVSLGLLKTWGGYFGALKKGLEKEVGEAVREDRRLPSFAKSPITQANDIRVDLKYNNIASRDGFYSYNNNYGYTDLESGERILMLPKYASKRYRTNYYDTRYLSDARHWEYVFSPAGSHWYGGTPIYLEDSKKYLGIKYIGLKINNPALVSDLDAEFAVDYYPVDDPRGALDNFGIGRAEASGGPVMYIKQLGGGRQRLEFVEEVGGVRWYKLSSGLISFEDLSLVYPYCYDFSSQDCHKINLKSFNDGNLRFHIRYTPNDQKGLLDIKLEDILVTDSEGSLFSVSKGDDRDDSYKAFLADYEKGVISLGVNRQSGVLEVIFENTGLDPITLDDYSFEYIGRRSMTKIFKGFSLKYEFSLIETDAITLDDIKRNLIGKTIEPGGVVSVSFVSLKTLKERDAALSKSLDEVANQYGTVAAGARNYLVTVSDGGWGNYRVTLDDKTYNPGRVLGWRNVETFTEYSDGRPLRTYAYKLYPAGDGSWVFEYGGSGTKIYY